MRFILKDIGTGETMDVSKTKLLRLINEGRNQDWEDYTLEDFVEGLEEFTDYELVGVRL